MARPGYRPALDGLRALAVLAVLVLHCWKAALPGGWVGVDLFFVLSGYLITSLLLSEHARTGTIRLGRFYLRRALRLLPALGLTVLLALIVVTTVRPDAASVTRHQAVAAALYAANWYLAANPAGDGLLGHTWSLAIEEQFYLIWPVLLWLVLGRGGRHVVLGVCLAGIAVVFLHRNGMHSDSVYFRTDTRADAFLIGCAIGIAADLGAFERVRRQVVTAFAAIGAGIIVATATLFNSITSAPGNYTVIDIAAGAVLVAVAVYPLAPSRLLMWRPFIWIGQRSYGIYLLHYPILGVLHMSPGPEMLAIGAPLSILAAEASYRYLELPFLRLKSRMGGDPPAEGRLTPATVAIQERVAA